LLGVSGGESITVDVTHLKSPNRRMALSIDCFSARNTPSFVGVSLAAGHPSKHCTNNPNEIDQKASFCISTFSQERRQTVQN
jgi:hypothetical protein